MRRSRLSIPAMLNSSRGYLTKPDAAMRLMPGLVVALYIAAGSILLLPGNVYAQPVTTYEYDANGNRTKVTDPLAHVTTYVYDALNRPIQQNQPNPSTTGQLGQVKTDYNALDLITKITDPRNLATIYTYNAFGNLLRLNSPDTGNPTNPNTYDLAGNLLSKQDANGQTATYAYDALNRPISITYSNTSLNVTYTYDQGTNGIGRLTGITDSTGTIAYTYDTRGRVVNEVRTIAPMIYTTTYIYDTTNKGQLTTILYPTGLKLDYTYDNLGRINQISSTKNNQTQLLASSIVYQPFGGVKSITFGNGAVYTRGFDTESRLASYKLGTQTVTLGYDDASRILSAAGADTKTYGYDNLDRLTTLTAPGINQTYGYDLTGNRNSLTVGANSYNYTIDSASNRMTEKRSGAIPGSGSLLQSFPPDSNGSITADGINQFTYDVRGRLASTTTAAGTVTYGVNALGQRVKKTAGGTSTVYHYDLSGHLIAETDALGVVKQETIYLNDIPLAVMQ